MEIGPIEDALHVIFSSLVIQQVYQENKFLKETVISL